MTRLRSWLVLLALLAGATGCSTGAAEVRPSARPDAPGSGAVPAPPTQPGTRLVPLSLGGSQKISGDAPAFPEELRVLGVVYTVLVKICISTAGSVDSVSLLQGAHPTLDMNVVNAVKGWRYRPLTVGNHAVPFCYRATFEFKAD